jgi:hypothetical protein
MNSYQMKKGVLLVGFATSSVACAQSFVNLNFDSPNPRAILGLGSNSGILSVKDAIPGWSLEIGSATANSVLFNITDLTDAGATLYSFSPVSPTLGRYTLSLSSGVDGAQLASVGISQTGTIPLGSQTLLFDTSVASGDPNFHVSINNQQLSLTPVQSPTGAYNYAASIGQFSGRTGTLLFSFDPGSFPYDGALLDNISFSSTALLAPEPSPWILSGLAGATIVIVTRIRMLSFEKKTLDDSQPDPKCAF